MRRLSVVLLSLFAVSCGSASNQQLETEVARLRIEVDELKAKNAAAEKTSHDSHSDAEGPSARTGSNRPQEDELGRDIRELQEEQRRILEELAERSANAPSPPSRPSRPRPDAASVYALSITGAPYEGARHAKVTVVKNFEFACQFCEKNVPVLEQLLKDYRGKIKVVYKHFIVHPSTATEPALAACAAGLQGKFPKMQTLIWKKAYPTRDFSRQKMERLAIKAGVRLKQFRDDRDASCVSQVRRDQDEAKAVGTRGTPSFYINGRFLSGAQPIHNFKTLIDEELKKANSRIGAGEATTKTYYQRFVMDRGLKQLATP